MFMLMLFSTRWNFPVAADFCDEIIFKSQLGPKQREMVQTFTSAKLI